VIELSKKLIKEEHLGGMSILIMAHADVAQLSATKFTPCTSIWWLAMNMHGDEFARRFGTCIQGQVTSGWGPSALDGREESLAVMHKCDILGKYRGQGTMKTQTCLSAVSYIRTSR
jgi:hypothetical protein